MDGEELLDRLIEQQVGVTKQEGELALDESYFQMLTAFCAVREKRRKRAEKRGKIETASPNLSALAGATFTIRFEGLPDNVRPRLSAVQ